MQEFGPGVEAEGEAERKGAARGCGAAGREGGRGATSRPRAGAGAAGGSPCGPVRGRRAAFPTRLAGAPGTRAGDGATFPQAAPSRGPGAPPAGRKRRPGRRRSSRPRRGASEAARTDGPGSRGWDVLSAIIRQLGTIFPPEII